ncbi:MAG: hypothetical protein AAB683_01470 [Patescibacteria group bacterium]
MSNQETVEMAKLTSDLKTAAAAEEMAETLGGLEKVLESTQPDTVLMQKPTTVVAIPPPAPPAPATVVEESDDGVNPMTPEAYDWAMSPDSIPGAFAPILYFGPQTVIDFSDRIGRPLTLKEVQRLAQPDGEKKFCSLTSKEFQPVVYVPFCPRNFGPKDDVLKADLVFGGQFYVVDKEIISVSGSVFFHNTEKDTYEYANSSAMVSTVLDHKRLTGKWRWPLPMTFANEVLEGTNPHTCMKRAASALAKKLAGR